MTPPATTDSKKSHSALPELDYRPKALFGVRAGKNISIYAK